MVKLVFSKFIPDSILQKLLEHNKPIVYNNGMTNNTNDTEISFYKMHGLGNDFVIIDERVKSHKMTSEMICSMGNRNLGIGFDQLVVISGGKKEKVYAHLSFWNSDGSSSATCGNATRCVANILMSEANQTEILLSTDYNEIQCLRIKNDLISVNMGQPQTNWAEIPLTQKVDTLKLPIEGNPVATNLGNPHCTFFVDDIKNINLRELGPQIENHVLFPMRTNVQIVEIVNKSKIKVQVWERGCGITLASGSSACAAVVAGNRLGLIDNLVKVSLEGGEIEVYWKTNGVWLTGLTKFVFSGAVLRSALIH